MRRVDRLLAVLLQNESRGTLVDSPGPGDSSGLGLDALSASSRPREWDSFVSTGAPDLTGDTLRFFALENGSLVILEDVADEAVSPLAEALHRRIQPPYRAAAARTDGDVWCAIAESVELIESPEIAGDEFELTDFEGRHELRVDGVLTAPIPEQLLAIVRPDGNSALIGERVADGLYAIKVWPL